MDMIERINAYWSKRADEFSNARLSDLKSEQREKWIEIIKRHLPKKEVIRALDLGTGAGFYAFLMSDLGCKVTGIDYSDKMIENSKSNAKLLKYEGINFMQMDAQDLKFKDNSFDFIISRNVTWTLPDPGKAYGEMCRILAPGGRILNFDANYGHAFKLADEAGIIKEQQEWSKEPYHYTAQSIDMIKERNDIAKSLYICDCIRPQWDIDVLLKNGIQKICMDINIGKEIYGNSKIFGNNFDTTEDGKTPKLPTSPLFMLCAEK